MGPSNVLGSVEILQQRTPVGINERRTKAGLDVGTWHQHRVERQLLEQLEVPRVRNLQPLVFVLNEGSRFGRQRNVL